MAGRDPKQCVQTLIVSAAVKRAKTEQDEASPGTASMTNPKIYDIRSSMVHVHTLHSCS
jgi:hypothetical protein